MFWLNSISDEVFHPKRKIRYLISGNQAWKKTILDRESKIAS